MDYSEFIAKVKELKTIKSVSGKEYRIDMVSNDVLYGVRSSTGREFDIPLKLLYNTCISILRRGDTVNTITLKNNLDRVQSPALAVINAIGFTLTPAEALEKGIVTPKKSKVQIFFETPDGMCNGISYWTASHICIAFKIPMPSVCDACRNAMQLCDENGINPSEYFLAFDNDNNGIYDEYFLADVAVYYVARNLGHDELKDLFYNSQDEPVGFYNVDWDI